jgi:hypothetical protein
LFSEQGNAIFNDELLFEEPSLVGFFVCKVSRKNVLLAVTNQQESAKQGVEVKYPVLD